MEVEYWDINNELLIVSLDDISLWYDSKNNNVQPNVRKQNYFRQNVIKHEYLINLYPREIMTAGICA